MQYKERIRQRICCNWNQFGSSGSDCFKLQRSRLLIRSEATMDLGYLEMLEQNASEKHLTFIFPEQAGYIKSKSI